MTPVSVGAPYPRLVGDIGGTHARFGWVEAPASGIGSIAVYESADYPGLEAAIAHYLVEHGHPPPAAGAMGVATAVVGDHVAMTNRDWAFSVDGVRRRLGMQRFIVLNDFTALALALPVLTAADLTRVGGGVAVPGAPVGLLGPGTGLGVSGLVPGAAAPIPIAGEGGHATLAAADAREEQVIARLRPRFDHVSAERALSGPGLVNLYEACCELAGAPSDALEPSDITERALAGSDARCVEAVELFFGFLGGVAGNLALTLVARGGVYVGGGIVPHLGDWIGRSAFRARFEAKGRFRSYLEAIPTWVITGRAFHALSGANRALDTGLAG